MKLHGGLREPEVSLQILDIQTINFIDATDGLNIHLHGICNEPKIGNLRIDVIYSKMAIVKTLANRWLVWVVHCKAGIVDDDFIDAEKASFPWPFGLGCYQSIYPCNKQVNIQVSVIGVSNQVHLCFIQPDEIYGRVGFINQGIKLEVYNQLFHPNHQVFF